MKRIFTVVALLSLVACTKNNKGSSASTTDASAGACAGDKLDLSKISGDWVADAPITQPEGNFPGNQYRIRFLSAPAADGTVKAILAWRLDARPYTGKYVANELGGQIELMEDMTDDTVKNLRQNKDPNQPMRSVVKLSPDDEGCRLFASDETITYVGDKDIRHTMLGALKLVPAPKDAQLSFQRCDAPRAVYFDGKADDNGAPVKVTAGKAIAAKVVREKKDLPECPYSADFYVDGQLATAKVPGSVGKEPAGDGKTQVDAVTWQNAVTFRPGPPHGVEVHTYADCTDGRKLIASACNQALTQ